MNLSSVKKILILVTILAVPGFLYYLLQEKGENRYHPLEFFGPKKTGEPRRTFRGKTIADTVYHQVDSFSLTNQSTQTVNFPADSARITVVNFFFVRCRSFCKDMNKAMARVAESYENNRMLQFFSISLDPGYDTPAVLAEYSESYNARPGKWDFLTGDENLIFKLARRDFLVDAIKDTSLADNFIHSPMLILLDSRRHIRGYYDSGSKDQVDKLIDEIKVLIAEELRSRKI
jgi:protein SCO1/2